jgi:predicted O-methyltransferase YrrM
MIGCPSEGFRSGKITTKCNELSMGTYWRGMMSKTGAGARNEALLRAAQIYEALGRKLDRTFDSEISKYAYRSAAEIDELNCELNNDLGGPFNGQIIRQQMFWRLVHSIGAVAIVETGTYRGTTTESIAQQFTGHIYTCELNRRYYEYARRKLASYRNVTIEHADSVNYLTKLLQSDKLDGARTIFYLDSHWNEDLPLLGELTSILDSGIPAAILIDDFAVPFDSGYTFDDYGHGKRLSVEILSGHLNQIKGIFFPGVSANLETGRRRGAVILATSDEVCATLCEEEGLRRLNASYNTEEINLE